MSLLKIIPYAYVPTKSRSHSNNQRPAMQSSPEVQLFTQQSDRGIFPPKALLSSVLDTPCGTLQAGEACGITQDPDILTSDVLLDTATIPPTETGNSQVISIESSTACVSSLRSGSIFDDIGSLFGERGICFSADCSEPIGCKDSVAKSDLPKSCSQLANKQSNNIKRIRDEGYTHREIGDTPEVLIDYISTVVGNNRCGSPVQTEKNGVFDKDPSNIGLRYSGLDTNPSLYDKDTECNTTPAANRRSEPYDDNIGSKRPRMSARKDRNISNEHILRSERSTSVIVNEGYQESELLLISPHKHDAFTSEFIHSLSPKSDERIVDAGQQWDVRKIIGKEYIDGVLHYLVVWCDTLEPEHSLGQASELVKEFEARIYAQREFNKRESSGLKRGRPVILEAEKPLGQQKRPRGRPRKGT